MFRIEGEEIQTNGDVEELLAKIRRDPRTSNPRVLVINQMEQMKARSGGYPIFMHHDTLLPIQVQAEREEEAMAQAGYRREYRHKAYPKTLFRRNMHPKFAKSKTESARIQAMTPEAQRIERATVNEGDYIEERIAQTPEEEAKILKRDGPNKAAGIGPWASKATDIEPFPDGPEEDPAVTIARLEGELNAAREKRPAKGAA